MAHPLKSEVLAILQEGQDMTVATLRPDGAPQATTVSYAADGLAVYFGCAASSQKAQNLARDPRVSATINLPYHDWSEIRGVSLGGRAERLTDADEIARVGVLFMGKFPEVAQYVETDGGDLALFRIRLDVVSVLDYRRGFGAHDLIGAGDLAA